MAAQISAESLRVVYMVQAGYDAKNVEQRGSEFTEETGIQVTFQFEEYEDIYDLVTGQHGQDGDFDIVLLDNIWTADFADRGILEPVQDNLRRRIETGMIPAIYNANMYKGIMWGVPFLANFQLLYTNINMLKEAGFSRPPQTLTELHDMAAQAKRRGIIEYPIFDSLKSQEVLVCELVWLSGAYGNNWDQNEEHLIIDRTENREAVKYLLKLKKEKLLNPYSLDSDELFSAEVFQWGDALFTTNWTFLIGRLNNPSSPSEEAPLFETKVSTLPVSASGGKSATVSGFQGLAVMKNSRMKKEAWKFIEFLSSPQFQRRYLHEFPVWKTVWEEPETIVRDPYFTIKRIQVEGAKVRPVHPRYQEISAVIQKWVHAALEERVSVDEAFSSIQNELNRLGL